MALRVFVETGAKRVFAGAIDWPGLARSGRTQEEALDRLFEYLTRYRRSVGEAARGLSIPRVAAEFQVTASLGGGSGTDFGVPSAVADFDREEPSTRTLNEQLERLRGAWTAFERATKKGDGKTLATGPRGGGRTVAKMREHVLEADRAYISSLGAKAPTSRSSWHEVQAVFVEAVHAKLRGELAEKGPRGGERWPALYAIRRSAWHALDHAWEIEDRLTG
jgi:hypothetical protein